MKPIFTILIMILFAKAVASQDSKVSATLSYPIPIGNNFVGENYTGIFDLGVQYTFVNAGPIKIGASVNGSYLTFDNDTFTPALRVNGVFIQPRIFGKLKIPALDRFRPSLGLGYTFISFSTDTVGIEQGDGADENISGFNLNLGAGYNFTQKFFVHLQYDFLSISREDDVPDNSFNNQISLIKIGVGYRF